jgi:hypothetical protein
MTRLFARYLTPMCGASFLLALAGGLLVLGGHATATQVQTAPTAYPVTDASGAITAGGSFQTVFAQTAGRHDCIIENPVAATETLFIHADAGSPTTANSFSIGAGAVFNCQAFGIVTPDTVQVEAATTGHAFVAKTQ